MRRVRRDGALVGQARRGYGLTNAQARCFGVASGVIAPRVSSRSVTPGRVGLRPAGRVGFVPPGFVWFIAPGRAGTRLRRLDALSAARGRGHPGGTGSRLREARRHCAATREAACAERPRSPLRLRRPAAFTATHASGRTPSARAHRAASPTSGQRAPRSGARFTPRGRTRRASRAPSPCRGGVGVARAWALGAYRAVNAIGRRQRGWEAGCRAQAASSEPAETAGHRSYRNTGPRARGLRACERWPPKRDTRRSGATMAAVDPARPTRRDRPGATMPA